MENSKTDVYKCTFRILKKIDSTKDTKKTRAVLANIRNSIEKDISNNVEALAFLFSNLPEEYIGYKKTLNNYEKAILTAIQMYALHQQANLDSVLKIDYKEGEWRKNIGDALNALRIENSEAIDRRFNAMITSRNFTELKNHLRQMIKLLKSKSDTKVDYASLADDLYNFLNNGKDGIKIKWSRSYYKLINQDKKGEN